MKKKSVIFLCILFLVICFASITTNLIIKANLNIGYDDKFSNDVIFIKAKTEGEASISKDGKVITYNAKKISEKDEETTLKFWVKNKNSQNDANVTINCALDEVSSDLADFVSVTIEPSKFMLLSNGVQEGLVTIKLKEVVMASKSGMFTCELVASPLSREEPGIITDTCIDDLNGAEPVVSGDLIPIELDSDGVVTYSDKGESWYSYCDKKWANAVILVDNPSMTYNVGDIIQENDIESYFVWIPRYKYKLFHSEQGDGVVNKLDESIAQEIEVEFEGKNVDISTGSKNGEWLTHPAFTNFDVNGLWVGKFETGYKGATNVASAEVNSSDSSKIQVKPNVYSWRNNSVGNFFKSMYNYNRELDSHMMKNTEWGAVAYLSHSRYGINTEVRINNNSNYLTGYSAIYKGDTHSTTETRPYNTEIGYLASTTGNISGIYDMSGCSWEYVAGYQDGVVGGSGLASAEITSKYNKYIDIYPYASNVTTYSNRILGDATGEMGPFHYDGSYRNNWYGEYSFFIEPSSPWFNRGGGYYNGFDAGTFYFTRNGGWPDSGTSARLVLLA